MDKNLTLKITGVVPLLMHNGQMKNPLNSLVQKFKTISAKRKKTDADLAQMSKLEWYGGLYYSNGHVVLPGECLEGTFKSAAKTLKRGKDVDRGLYIDDAKLEYSGPKKIDVLWKDEKFRFIKAVNVQGNAVMRTRPKFDKWSATIIIRFNSAIFNEADILQFAQIAGEQIGLLDWRPKFGRFKVQEVK